MANVEAREGSVSLDTAYQVVSEQLCMNADKRVSLFNMYVAVNSALAALIALTLDPHTAAVNHIFLAYFCCLVSIVINSIGLRNISYQTEIIEECLKFGSALEANQEIKFFNQIHSIGTTRSLNTGMKMENVMKVLIGFWLLALAYLVRLHSVSVQP
ncbi:MAG: hypothetical protein AAGD13_16285 [Pseudomonadota bacterium]